MLKFDNQHINLDSVFIVQKGSIQTFMWVMNEMDEPAAVM